ncbi:MAG TPA: molybdenum cofactor synthesis domain-containing protein, partial [Aeromicrobium sp.]|nr:molybdenum cofactor synthesis domain-containing protein [Aeromicrobium sp.]
MSVVRRAVVITVSDRVTAGAREDVSGRVGADLLEEAGWQAARVTVSDDRAAIADSIESAVTGGAELVVTTGGTGVGPRDVTPEATGPLLRMQLPGIAEQIRDVGVQKLPQAMLSRGVAGI